MGEKNKSICWCREDGCGPCLRCENPNPQDEERAVNEIDKTKRVWRVTFRREDGRRETQFFNAVNLIHAVSMAETIAKGQPYEAPYEIDPVTGTRK